MLVSLAQAVFPCSPHRDSLLERMLELVNLCDWQPAAMGCLYTIVKFGVKSLIFCEWMGKKAPMK